MPRIPDYNQQAQSDAGPQLQVQTSAPIEAFGGGQALQGMEAAGKLAAQSAEMFTEIKKQADVSKVLQANTLTTTAKNQSLYDPNTGAMYLKGQAAFGATQAYGDSFKAQTDKIAASLDNDDQRAMYEKVRKQAAEEMQGTLEKHTFAEAQSFQKEQYSTSMKTALNDAAINYNVPEKISQSASQVRGLALKQADADGITDPEMREARAKDAESKVYLGVMERMLNTNDPRAAGYFMARSENMTQEDRQKIEPSLKTASLASESSKKADEISAQSPSLTSQLEIARQMEPGELRDKVITRLKESSTDKKMALEADSNRSYSGLSSIVEQSNGWGSLPITEMQKLTSEDRGRLEARIRQLKEGVTAEKASRAYYKLMNTAAENPGQFKSMNLDRIRGSVTAEELTKFIGMQDELKAGKGVKALDQHRSAQAIADDGARAAGLKGRIWDASGVQKYQDEFFRRLDVAAEDKGKPLNDAEMTRIRDEMLTKVVVKGVLWNSKEPAYQIEALKDGEVAPDIGRIQDVPDQTLRQIRTMMARHGIKYSDEAALGYANRALRTTVGK